MKLLSTYRKEMTIAARGFYFYIEIFFAVLLLVLLLFAVKEQPVSMTKEFLYYDMPASVVEASFAESVAKGTAKFVEDTTFTTRPISFTVTNEETGDVTAYDFDEESLTFRTVEIHTPSTGDLEKTLYLADSERDMIRMSYGEKAIGATISLDERLELSYRYFIQGFETQRLKDLLYILHNESTSTLQEVMDQQVIRKLSIIETLNARENLVPVLIVFMGSMMGFFIVMAYIFLDKAEGVIRAFAVTPSSVWKYLLTKNMVIMSTVVISSSIITIPIMKGQPNYLLFYLLLLVTTFAFASLGLLIASFFESISKAFGALYTIMVVMMIPAFSYFVPSFDPIWLRFFPTYSMLQGFKEIIMEQTDVPYVLGYTGIFLAAGVVIFILANIRFKKTLTV